MYITCSVCSWAWRVTCLPGSYRTWHIRTCSPPIALMWTPGTNSYSSMPVNVLNGELIASVSPSVWPGGLTTSPGSLSQLGARVAARATRRRVLHVTSVAVTADTAGLLLSVFLASAVEFVEALTIVLAMGVTRGWRSALAGVARRGRGAGGRDRARGLRARVVAARVADAARSSARCC